MQSSLFAKCRLSFLILISAVLMAADPGTCTVDPNTPISLNVVVRPVGQDLYHPIPVCVQIEDGLVWSLTCANGSACAGTPMETVHPNMLVRLALYEGNQCQNFLTEGDLIVNGKRLQYKLDATALDHANWRLLSVDAAGQIQDAPSGTSHLERVAGPVVPVTFYAFSSVSPVQNGLFIKGSFTRWEPRAMLQVSNFTEPGHFDPPMWRYVTQVSGSVGGAVQSPSYPLRHAWGYADGNGQWFGVSGIKSRAGECSLFQNLGNDQFADYFHENGLALKPYGGSGSFVYACPQ